MTTSDMPRELTGTRERVRQDLVRLHEAGLLARFAPPEPHPRGCRVEWWLRQPVATQTRAAYRPTPMARAVSRQGWTPRDLTPAQRTALKVGGTVLAVGGVLAWVVWLVIRAVSGVWSAATANPFLAWAVVVLAGAGVVKWLTRERSPKTSGGGHGGGCPGLIQHCRGCGHH